MINKNPPYLPTSRARVRHSPQRGFPAHGGGLTTSPPPPTNQVLGLERNGPAWSPALFHFLIGFGEIL
ncbi:NADH dehydrogenase alpha subunit [Lyngbya sp. PCC 8106]|nr:NADH dehydrogenase alpha subunit [Lyngbya sp. PCC 8106]